MTQRSISCHQCARRIAGALLMLAAIAASAQSDRDMLATCLDTYEGEETHQGRRFTRPYARHVLFCNYRVDMLDGHDERRDAYERWRTQIYQNDLARMAAAARPPGPAARPPAAGRRTTTPTTPPAPAIDSETLSFARCLTDRADRLALTEPDLDQDPARARLLAEEIAEDCFEAVGAR